MIILNLINDANDNSNNNSNNNYYYNYEHFDNDKEINMNKYDHLGLYSNPIHFSCLTLMFCQAKVEMILESNNRRRMEA